MGSFITLSTLFQLVCLQSLFCKNLVANSMNSSTTVTSNCGIDRYGAWKIDCSRLNLTHFSLKKYSGDYFSVDFSGNNFQELNNDTFHIEDDSMNIIYISYLYLNSSNISTITDDVINNRVRIDFGLNLSNNRLTRIPFLNQQNGLKILYLQHNRIEVIEAKSLHGLTNLALLNLSYCEIYMVEPDAFDGLMELNILFLNNNRLGVLAIPLDKLNRFQWLREFDISNNKFDCNCYNYELAKFIVSKDFSTLRSGNMGCLLQLDDSFCAPKDVTFASSNYSWMAICGVNTNNNSGNTFVSFYKIDDEGNHREIMKNLPVTKLDKITDDAGNSRIGYKYNLKYAQRCLFCRIYCVAENMAGRTSSNILFTDHLSEYTSQLFLSSSEDECKSLCINCRLTNIPEMNLLKYECPPSKTFTINFSSNNLQYLAENIIANQKGYRSAIRNLILRNCHISGINDGAFNGIPNLMLLDLNGNALTVVPTKSFVPINQLRALDLGGNNQLEKLDSNSFKTLKRLTILNLTSCAILQIPTETFISLKSTLVELRMGNNSLENVSFLDSTVSIHQLAPSSNVWKKLVVLDLSRNPLKQIHPFSFSNMVALKYLDLSSCKTFLTIPNDTFYGLGQLRTLILSSNKIQEIEVNAFASLINITELKLNDNGFNELSVQVFNGLSTNQTRIDLKENMFQCTCHNLNLSRWLKSNPNVANNMINDCSKVYVQLRCDPEISRMDQIDNRNIECEVKAKTGHAEITWFWDNLPIPDANSFATSIVKKPKPYEEDIFISRMTFAAINLTYMGSNLKCVAKDEVGEITEGSKAVNITKTKEYEIYITPLFVKSDTPTFV